MNSPLYSIGFKRALTKIEALDLEIPYLNVGGGEGGDEDNIGCGECCRRRMF